MYVAAIIHLPPIPASYVLAAIGGLLLVRIILGAIARKVRRAHKRQLRQALVTGIAVGMAGGWTVGRRSGLMRVARL